MRGRDYLRAGSRYGPAKQRRLLACQGRFPERRGSAFFGARLTDAQAPAVFQHRRDGCGVRQTARLIGVAKSYRTKLLAGS